MLSLIFQTGDLTPERVGDVIDAAKADPVLAGMLIAAGLATLGLFFWGVIRQVFKAALFAGLASAGIWYWYLNVR
jgi:hypothetical protein